jgi:hypothetical protein
MGEVSEQKPLGRWAVATFGARHSRRRVALLTVLGMITGAGEALVVLLLVAIASGGSGRLPGFVPSGGTWPLTGLTLAVVSVLASAHFASARTGRRVVRCRAGSASAWPWRERSSARRT